MKPSFSPLPFLHQDEGQHFERKSLLSGADRQRTRDRREVRDQVAEVVAGFANAEGGVLILGIEDDGTATGHRYPPEAISAILATPRNRLLPAQPEGFLVIHEGMELLVFDVPTADGPVQVDGDGFPLRIGDRTVQASEVQIRAFKFQGMAESWESRPSPLGLADLDPDLLARARRGAGREAWSDEEYLLARKLADRRGSLITLRRAAELLFGQRGAEHPNAGVRVFRVIGTERRLGPEHNVEERPRIEGPLPVVLDEALGVVAGLLRRPSRLVGNRFREVPEYPDFSWKEAIVNAVAHRDYSVEGSTTEVWLFEDRMEVSSPGGLVGDLRMAEVVSGQRVHRSRNPRLVRALVDLGAVRDQGEGIPVERSGACAIGRSSSSKGAVPRRTTRWRAGVFEVPLLRTEPSSTRIEPSSGRTEPSSTRIEPSSGRTEPSSTRIEPSCRTRCAKRSKAWDPARASSACGP